ncbi:MAG: hypothetical protein K6T83_03600 [Alicyclobacillus sp.]|nr:hypothetical protein [Alicyclobacillus sp.]
MVAAVDLTSLDLWYKVDHDNFAEDMVYRAIAYLDYGETATGQLLFITDEGATFALPVDKTRCVRGHERLSREIRPDEDQPFFEPGEIKSWR